MQIRPIKVSDLERFTALWNRVYSEGEFLISPAPDSATLRSILQRVENESIPQFVAFDRQELIGSVESSLQKCAVTKAGSSFASVFLVFTSTKATEAKD